MFFNWLRAMTQRAIAAQLTAEAGARRAIVDARASTHARRAAAIRRGRRATDRSACRRRHPCRRSCRVAPTHLRRRGCRRRSERRGRARRRSASTADDHGLVRAGHDRACDGRRRGSARRSCARASRAATSRSSGVAPGRRGLEIERLAADHAAAPGRFGDDADHAGAVRSAERRRTPSRPRPARARAARRLRSAARRRRESPSLRRGRRASVGRPRRSVSLSIAGRSSWTSE